MPIAEELGVESVLDVLENVFKIDGTQRGDEYDMLCPNPQHLDSRPSTGVNLTTGLWNCFSCGCAGDLVRLGQLTLDMTRPEVERLLKPSTPEAIVSLLQRRLQQHLKRPSSSAPPKPLPGPYDPGPLTYLRRRGFAQETLRRWGVRYVQEEELEGKKGTFKISHSLAIPVRDQNGSLLNWCYRATPDSLSWQPRYMYFTEGIDRQWFGLQHHATAKDIIITEGALDAMWVDQCGYPALGMLGASLSDAKVKSLQRHSSVTVLGDFDAAGVQAVRKIGAVLGDRMPVLVCRYSKWMNAKDPQELSPVDMEIAIESAIPWTLFVQKFAQAS